MDKKLPRIYLLATLTVALFSTQNLVAQSLSFDGSDDYVDFGDVDEVEGLDAITVEAWIYPHVLNLGRQYIIAKEDSWYLTTEQNVLIFGIHGEEEPFANYTIPDVNQWYHIVGVSDSDNNTTLYVNGSQVSQVTSTTIPSSIYKLSFGSAYKNGSYWEHYFDGQIDEVAIWNDALSAMEVAALYNSGSPISASTDYLYYTSANDLVGYWPMNEGSGS